MKSQPSQPSFFFGTGGIYKIFSKLPLFQMHWFTCQHTNVSCLVTFVLLC